MRLFASGIALCRCHESSDARIASEAIRAAVRCGEAATATIRPAKRRRAVAATVGIETASLHAALASGCIDRTPARGQRDVEAIRRGVDDIVVGGG